ncbi:hypothetical protein B7982_08790 [Fibrobacter sp. UWB2]|nr:hypothetical protein B7982_08790 [Fibrobacter sp. UWB2]
MLRPKIEKKGRTFKSCLPERGFFGDFLKNFEKKCFFLQNLFFLRVFCYIVPHLTNKQKGVK